MSYQEEVKTREARVSIQLEKIYRVVAEGAELVEVKREYRDFVKKLSDLYSLLFEKSSDQKEKEILVKQYRAELSKVAAAIDMTLGLE